MHSVLQSVAYHHFVNTWRERRTPLLWLVALLFSGTMLWQSYTAFVLENQSRIAAVNREEVDWQNRRASNPHGAAHFGRYVIRPLPPLYFFDPGVLPYQGAAVRVQAHQQDPARDPQGLPADFLSVFGLGSPAHCLQMLFPLLIVLFSFDSIAGDRESGILKLIAAQGTSLRSLAAGRLASLCFQWLVPYLAIVGLVWQLVPVNGREPDSISILFLGYGIYLLLHTFTCLAISLSSRTARLSLTLCLAWWTLSCLVMPRIAAEAVQVSREVIASAQFFTELREDLKRTTDGHNSGAQHLIAIKERLLKEYGVSRVEDLPINFDGVALEEGERMTSSVYRKSYERYWRGLQDHDAQAQTFALVSPLLALRSFSQTISATGIAAQVDFERQVASYGVEFVQAMNRTVTTHGKLGDWSLRMDKNYWIATPKFQFLAQSSTERFIQGKRPLLILLAGMGLAWAAVWYLTRTSRGGGG